MECPKGDGALQRTTVGPVQVERCPVCGGSWYDIDELRILKDRESHGDYCWIDFDLWKDKAQFRAAQQERYKCPRDSHPMTTVHYGTSHIRVDICDACRGIWLDRQEYEAIIAYLERMVVTESVSDYLQDVRDELVELFTVREDPLSEMRGLGKVLYLLQLRFGIEHPALAALLRRLPD